MEHIHKLFLKTNGFKLVPAWCRVNKMLSDTFSILNKLNHGKYSKYQLCSSKINIQSINPMIQIQILLKWFQGTQDALGHPKRPRQAQPWEYSTESTSSAHQNLSWYMLIYYFSKTFRFKMVPVQQVPVIFIKIWHRTYSYLVKLNHGEYRIYRSCSLHGTYLNAITLSSTTVSTASTCYS